ncbi:MAG: serine protein kinase RIO [Promethearchaeota archaeon]|nr:MAG: serine protein kinase RIO [Candidatus Lokiarchaeota archaeon]
MDLNENNYPEDDELTNKDDYSELDDIEIKNIDAKRIKKIDRTKKIAAVESVFDERTYSLLNKLSKNGLLTELYGLISAGKEANVYLAINEEGKEVALKIYKIDRNTSKWMRNYIVGDPRFKKIPNNISKIIFLWASKEFKNLKRAYKVGLKVPKPVLVRDNILIMDYIGVDLTPAPRLKDVKNLLEADKIFREVLDFIKILYQKAHLVHGDLSEFNILYHNYKPIVIDISQAVDIQHPKAEVFLSRDIKNIFNFFEKLGVIIPDPQKFYYEVINVQK